MRIKRASYTVHPTGASDTVLVQHYAYCRLLYSAVFMCLQLGCKVASHLSNSPSRSQAICSENSYMAGIEVTLAVSLYYYHIDCHSICFSILIFMLYCAGNNTQVVYAVHTTTLDV